MHQMLSQLTLASRSDRLFGQALDGLVGGAPILLGSILMKFSNSVSVPLVIAGLVWAGVYHLFADGLRDGQSLGKRRIGMRVIDAETGAPCTFGKSFLRNFLAILGPLDWIFIFGERHQRLGDKAAGTIVVYD